MNNAPMLLEKLKAFEGRWVAIREGKEVVASGKDALEAKQQAEAKGFHDVILFKVFPFEAGYVPDVV